MKKRKANEGTVAGGDGARVRYVKTKMDIEKKRNIEERQTERERERKVREEKWSR